jgi:hypothetical protein
LRTASCDDLRAASVTCDDLLDASVTCDGLLDASPASGLGFVFSSTPLDEKEMGLGLSSSSSRPIIAALGGGGLDKHWLRSEPSRAWILSTHASISFLLRGKKKYERFSEPPFTSKRSG